MDPKDGEQQEHRQRMPHGFWNKELAGQAREVKRFLEYRIGWKGNEPTWFFLNLGWLNAKRNKTETNGD